MMRHLSGSDSASDSYLAAIPAPQSVSAYEPEQQLNGPLKLKTSIVVGLTDFLAVSLGLKGINV